MSRPLILYERLTVPVGQTRKTTNANFTIRPPDRLKVDWIWLDTQVPPFTNWNNFLVGMRRISRRDFQQRPLAIPAWHNIPREFSPWAWQLILREPYRVGANESFSVMMANPTLSPIEFTIAFHCVGVESGDNRILSAAVNLPAAAAQGQIVRRQFGDRDTANDGLEPLLLKKVSIEPAQLINPRQILMQIKPSEDIAWSDDVIPMLAYFPDVGPYGHFFRPYGEIVLEMMDGLEFTVTNNGVLQDPDFIYIAMAGHILTEAESISGEDS